MEIDWKHTPYRAEHVNSGVSVRERSFGNWEVRDRDGMVLGSPHATLAEAQSWAERWIRGQAQLAEVRAARERAATEVAAWSTLLGEALALEKRITEAVESHAPGFAGRQGTSGGGKSPERVSEALSGRGGSRWPAHYFPVHYSGSVWQGQRRVGLAAPVNAVSPYPVAE